MTGPAGEARINDLFVISGPDESHPGRQILRVIEGVRGAVGSSSASPPGSTTAKSDPGCVATAIGYGA